MKTGKAVEMTGVWKTRKTKGRFPFVSHSPWKSQKARFPHSHRPCDLLFQNLKTKSKGGPSADRFAPAFRLILQ